MRLYAAHLRGDAAWSVEISQEAGLPLELDKGYQYKVVAPCAFCGGDNFRQTLDKEGEVIEEWICPHCEYGEVTIAENLSFEEVAVRYGSWYEVPGTSATNQT